MRTPNDPWRRVRSFLVVLCLVAGFARPAAHAYNATPEQWPDGPINLVFALGAAGRTLQDGNTSWDAVAQGVANEWNRNLGLVQFVPVVDDGATAQQGDGKNTVAFSSSIYGDSFGDETIAVTLLHHTNTTTIGEADVLVNSADTFDSYGGALKNPGTSQNIDLHRVLLHEFGHVLGLDHPDKIGQTVAAIMNSVISNTDQLTPDDTSGTTSIYGDPSLRSVEVTAYGLAIDNGRGKLYVTTVKGNGNGALKVIDPYAAQITASIRTGPQPNVLALSGGGEHLYMGVDGLGIVDQIDPDTLATTQQFALGAQSGVTAADMSVLPGAPESVVVSQQGNTQGALLHNSPTNSGDFAVYDQGILRPQEEFDRGVSPGSPLILDESGQTFYAFEGAFYGATSGEISRYTLNAQGVSPNVQEDFLASGDLDGGAEYSQGVLYGSDGSVADLVHGVDEAPFVDVRAAGRAYTVEVDGTLGQAYFAVPREGTSFDNYTPTLLVEDIATRSQLGSIALPRYGGVYLMRRWGVNGLVICLSDKQMLLVRSNIIVPGAVTGAPEIVTLGAPTTASVAENAPVKAKLTVTRTNSDFSAPLAVQYNVTGTAQNGVDYRLLSGVVIIPAGETTAKIKVIPSGSQFSDSPRTVQIRLAQAPSYRWGTSSAATVTLTSN